MTSIADQGSAGPPQHTPAKSVPVRPDCWEFAMDFLGDPEAGAIELYINQLETEVARLRFIMQQFARHDGCDWAERCRQRVATARGALR